MGLFSFFSNKKKERDYREIEKVFADIEGHAESDFHRPESRQHFVFDKCEQMIECSHRMDEARMEYDSVTSYLMDIDVIEGLPPGTRDEINDLAERIHDLQADRKEYQEYSAKMEDVRFAGIRMYEDEFPDNIARLKENERYKALVKRDIDTLQGEKSVIQVSIDEALENNRKLKKWAFILPFFFAILLVSAFFLKAQLFWDITTMLCIIIFVTCVAGSAVILRNQKNNLAIKQGKVNLNHAIVLLNRMKAKYVNVTNAVDYTYERFNVNSSYELEYLWNEYSDLKKERAKHSLGSTDIDFYTNQLIHELAKYDINDPHIWGGQVLALIDRNEMVEIRHNLNQRRQKLRARIEHNANEAEAYKNEILEMIKEYPQYSEEVLEMVKSIDSTKRI